MQISFFKHQFWQFKYLFKALQMPKLFHEFGNWKPWCGVQMSVFGICEIVKLAPGAFK